MITRLVFETHAWSEDNDRGLASGWRDSCLSPRGRDLAIELGARRRDDGVQAVFSSDLLRAVETVQLAFADGHVPRLYDWRLRECDYGEWNGAPAAQVHHERRHYLDTPYPGGESWRQAVQRVGRFLVDLPLRWTGQRVLVVGHVATKWAFDHLIDGVPIEDLLVAEFDWREGWEYRLKG